jgi:hypothetical protein
MKRERFSCTYRSAFTVQRGTKKTEDNEMKGVLIHTGEERCVYRGLVRIPGGKQQLERPGCKWV